MRISITNFRNISSLDYDLVEGKVNFLFGVCGSGKSSLLDAISSPIQPGDVTVGEETSSTKATIDGESPDHGQIAIYNAKRQGVLYEETTSGDSYNIFVGDAKTLQNLEQQFNEAIEQLRDYREKLYPFRSQMDDLGKLISKPPKNGYTKSSKLSKMCSGVYCAKPMARKAIDSLSSEHMAWIVQGFTVSSDYSIGKCPFCAQDIKGDKLQRLSEIDELDSASIKPIFQATTLLNDLSIEPPEYSDEDQIKDFKKQVFDLFQVRQNIQELLDFCQSTHSLSSINEGFDEIKLLEETKRRFPDIVEVVESVNSHSMEIRKLLGQMSSELSRIIRKNEVAINSQLKSLGIPYRFAVDNTDRNAMRASYELIHIKSAREDDMRNSLSTGEKNLVTLLLFLRHQDKKLILIDDPASSYDDYRRSQIFELILENKTSTILVVSHDQCFVRRAARAANKQRIGKIQQIAQTPHGIEVRNIDRDSFGAFDEFIRTRVNESTSFYQAILNARLYIDIHRKEFSDEAWQYTSAVLHKTNIIELGELLDNLEVAEDCIIQEIEDRLNTKLPVRLADEAIDYSSLSKFERLIAKREDLRRLEGAGVDEVRQRKMLNDLVHMNDGMLFCLNPYEYEVWAPSLNELLD